MKTKGVNTREDIDNYKSDKSKQTRLELALKSMLISCFTYETITKDNRYIAPYIERLGKTLFDEVYEEQKTFLEKNYLVKTNVYTDSEGLNYNSLILK